MNALHFKYNYNTVKSHVIHTCNGTEDGLLGSTSMQFARTKFEEQDFVELAG